MDEQVKDWRKQGQARARQLGLEALGLPGQGCAPCATLLKVTLTFLSRSLLMCAGWIFWLLSGFTCSLSPLARLCVCVFCGGLVEGSSR